MVFGLFSKDRALKRTIEKATNKLSRSEERWAAMEKLSEDGSEEALLGLCRRFSFVSDKTIEDQKEKGWAVQELVAKGDAAVGPLRTYLKSATALHYPLDVLSRLLSPDACLEVIDELIAEEEPGYSNNPKRRIDIIEFLGTSDLDGTQVAPRVIPYLADFDETVRFKVVETLSLKPDACAGEPLARALVNEEEESLRLKHRIAEVLAEHDLELGEYKSQVSAMLNNELSDFKLHRNKLQQKG